MEDVIDVNLRTEVELTNNVVGLGSKPGLTMAIDMGWNKRSSGRTYNAASGQHFCIGMMSRLCINLKFLNKRCTRCEKVAPTLHSVPKIMRDPTRVWSLRPL